MQNEILLRHITAPYHIETMVSADGVGQVGFLGKGPFMISYLLQGNDGVIERASFETYGCPYAISCGRWLAQ